MTWAFAGMVDAGEEFILVHGADVLDILLPQLQLDQVSGFIFSIRIITCYLELFSLGSKNLPLKFN